MTNEMIYPGNTVAPVVHTDFIDGIRFDVCEVVKEAYEYLDSPKSRFFLYVEDSHILNFKFAENLFSKIGQVRWGFFCYTKAECISLITDFSKSAEKLISLEEKAKAHPKASYGQQARKLVEHLRAKYGVAP